MDSLREKSPELFDSSSESNTIDNNATPMYDELPCGQNKYVYTPTNNMETESINSSLVGNFDSQWSDTSDCSNDLFTQLKNDKDELVNRFNLLKLWVDDRMFAMEKQYVSIKVDMENKMKHVVETLSKVIECNNVQIEKFIQEHQKTLEKINLLKLSYDKQINEMKSNYCKIIDDIIKHKIDTEDENKVKR